MNVIALNGSPRRKGNTYRALRVLGDELEAAGIEFEIVQIGHLNIRGCTGCLKCSKTLDGRCSVGGDDFNGQLPKIRAADGLVLGSPVHYSGIAGTVKSFLDRLFYVSAANGNWFRHKVGAAVVAVRRSGGSSALDGLNHYLHYAEMIIATSNYWNIIHGAAPGEAAKDTEGVQIMRVLGKNMAWIMKMKESSTVTPPEKEKKEKMSFIR